MSNVWRGIIENLLFPPRCMLCGRLIRWEDELCPDCGKRYAHPTVHSEENRFGCDGVLWCGEYKGVLRRAVERLKFKGHKKNAEYFGRIMTEAIRACRWQDKVDGITYVPMSPEHLSRRGYNQSRLLAEYIAKELGLPLYGGVLKRRGSKTAHKSAGQAERKKLVRESYLCGKERLPEGARILLVDDIITTGVTAETCSGLLRRQGAGEVWMAAALYTPKRHPNKL